MGRTGDSGKKLRGDLLPAMVVGEDQPDEEQIRIDNEVKAMTAAFMKAHASKKSS